MYFNIGEELGGTFSTNWAPHKFSDTNVRHPIMNDSQNEQSDTDGSSTNGGQEMVDSSAYTDPDPIYIWILSTFCNVPLRSKTDFVYSIVDIEAKDDAAVRLYSSSWLFDKSMINWNEFSLTTSR